MEKAERQVGLDKDNWEGQGPARTIVISDDDNNKFIIF